MSDRPLIFASALTFVVSLAGMVANSQQPPTVLPASVGDLAQAQLVEVRDAGGQVLLHGTLKTSANTAKETKRAADLASPSGQAAKGEVGIEIERKDGGVEEELDIEVEKLPAAANCTLWLDGQRIADFVTSKKGKAELELGRKRLP